jgi:hypothetical protein
LQAEGKPLIEHPAFAVIDLLLNEYNRPGKAAGGGFYEYPAGGQKHLWPELKSRFEKADGQISPKDVRDRLLFVQAIETVRCVEEGVLTSTADANVGSIFGIGFAAWTGGALQFINQYGVKDFVARAQYLAGQYGERFAPPALLLDKAAKGERSKGHGDAFRGLPCQGVSRQALEVCIIPITCQVFFMSLRICILETDILRPELVDQYQGYGQMFQRLFSQQPIAAEFTSTT